MVIYSAKSDNCQVILEKKDSQLVLTLGGRLDANSLTPFWEPLLLELQKQNGLKKLSVYLDKVDYLDISGATFLESLSAYSEKEVTEIGLSDRFIPIRQIAPRLPESSFFFPSKKTCCLIQSIGHQVTNFLADFRQQIVFTGKIFSLFSSSLLSPQNIRWRETFVVIRKSGADALPIVSLIGLLMGMILAFQSAVPLRQFGVDIFVVNLVVLAILRELGVIMTAIMFAGRSASAFAAELGTMRVNEEINALVTFGLDPIRFLVLPRVIAGTIVVPLLTIYANVIGILGGLFVVTTFGYSWQSVWTQAFTNADLSDVATGLIKSFVFGFLVSAAGCLRGLQTQGGAIAVGVATTRAVVASIILIITADLLFALVFYSIGF